MINTFLSEEWSFIAIIFFGIIAYIAWIRWQDHRWIENRFGRDNVIAMSFGINYFGRTSEPGKAIRSSGFLILLKDRVVYRSRWKKKQVEITGVSIRRLYPDSVHKNTDLHQSVMKIDFELEGGRLDSVAFRVPYPPQWIQAIANISPNLLKQDPE
ncbi:hypothetical protein KJ966_15095 [bacterium]|nr:hypothetical protein [bacterium]